MKIRIVAVALAAVCGVAASARAEVKVALNPGGRVFLGLNPAGPNKEFYTPELRDFFLSRGASVERENILFPPQV